MKRYTMTLQDKLFEEVDQEAQRRHSRVAEVMRDCITIGLLALRADLTGQRLMLQDGQGHLTDAIVLAERQMGVSGE